METKTILIIEDEPFLSDAYKLVFKSISEEYSGYNFKLKLAHTFEEGKGILLQHRDKDIFGTLTVLIDLRLKSIHHSYKKSGEELAREVRRLYFNAKIIIITSSTQKYRFYTIFKNVDPEGFLIKSEIDFEIVKKAIVNVLEGHSFFTKSISDFLRKSASMALPIDEFDRKLLYLLSQGLNIKELSNELNLSVSGIEWRQRKLSKLFNLENVRINTLLQRANELGLI